MTPLRDMAVVWRDPGELSPHPHNPRTHSDEQKEQLFASVSRFGWTVPVIVDEDLTILAGHGRWEMATGNKLEQVPTIQITGLSEDEKRAYLIADNRLSENADWDIPQLLDELNYLSSHAIDPDTLGFSDADIIAYHSTIDDTGFVEPVDQPSPPGNAASSISSGERSPLIESTTEPTQLQSDNSEYQRVHPGAETEAATVPFSLMLPVDDRERVYAVLNAVQADSMAEALMVVIDAFDADPPDEESANEQ